MRTITVFSLFVLSVLGSKITANSTFSHFAYLIELTHVCNGVCGSVEFGLNGNPENYTYYWTHGPTTLRLDCLEPGIYTLVVEDMYGCIETYEVEILRLSGCTMTYEILPTFNPCKALISIRVMDGNGVQIDESSLNIVWQDGDPSGLQRIVDLSYSADYCVSITLNTGLGDVSTCCELEECISVIENPKCSITSRRQVIVNELHRSDQVDDQFIELLVIGNGICGDSFDMRGMIVDDNNGFLIPAGDYLNEYNVQEIGIDKGFLTFSFDSTWQAVPNGSLIVIHATPYTDLDLIQDDPTDADQDGVYILSVQDSSLLWGRSGVWDDIDQKYNYDGYIVPSSWSLIEPSANVDGAQVIYPNGEFSHGVSIGQSPFSGSNDFELWLTPSIYSTYNIQLVLSDYLDKTHFAISDATTAIPTPGMPNSLENSLLIDSLKGCTTLGGMQNDFHYMQAGSIDDLDVYPNPFNNQLKVQFDSPEKGQAIMILFSATGALIDKEELTIEFGFNEFTVDHFDSDWNGLTLLKFILPSGKIQTKKVIRVRMD